MLPAGEVLAGPQQILMMDEITTGTLTQACACQKPLIRASPLHAFMAAGGHAPSCIMAMPGNTLPAACTSLSPAEPSCGLITHAGPSCGADRCPPGHAGLDSSTAFHIISHLRDFTHKRSATVLIALLQPAPEVYNLLDDVLLISEGQPAWLQTRVLIGPADHVPGLALLNLVPHEPDWAVCVSMSQHLCMSKHLWQVGFCSS